MTTSSPREGHDPHEEAALWAARLAEEPAGLGARMRFETWLNADPLNVAHMDDIVRSWEAVEAHAAADSIMRLREAALASARAGAIEDHGRWRGFSWRSALAAASILLAVMGTGIWMMLQPTTYRTGIGERRIVTLADGSTASLDAGTTVEVLYTHGDREINLEQGRAKFVVTKDALRPFSVRAGSKLVVATGTAFSVERLRDTVNVILYEGRVALLDGSKENYKPIALRLGAKGPDQRLLAPNQQVTFPATDVALPGESILVSHADPARTLAWEQGQLIFNDEPLSRVIERMNRYADRPLRIGEPVAQSLRVSGVFRAGDTQALVQGLQATFDVRVAQEPNAVAIFAKPVVSR